MHEHLSLTIAAAFAVAVAILIGLGLSALRMTLNAQQRHRQRLARVAHRRQSGRLDYDDVRHSVLRQKDAKSALDAFSEAFAPFIPLLNAERLRADIERAGLKMSLGGFILVSLLVAGLLAPVVAVLGGVPLFLLVPAPVVGMLLVNAFVRGRGEVLANRFMLQLPDALDTVIRGIRSGLPVIECIATVGREAPAPLGQYFQLASERVRLGEPLEIALWRVTQTVRRSEMNFLAVSISIQMETGGSLAEALGNLADLLRNRQRMKLKIKAISSEARMSGLIIGALPIVMLVLLSLMSPDYVAPLFSDPRGNTMLLLGLASIATGAFFMWRMTKFEI